MSMWEQLLPKLVGRTITDDDAPSEPAVITGYTLTDGWVEVQTADWSWGCNRKYVGLTAGPVAGSFHFQGPGGMGAVIAPASPDLSPSKEPTT